VIECVENFEEDENSSRIPIDDLISMSRISIDFETSVLKLMMSRYFQGKTRFKMAVRFVISQVSRIEREGMILFIYIDEIATRVRT
jgi:hypothetical protein